VLHPPGRPGQSQPPRHGIAPRGGAEGPAHRWEPLQSVPDARRRRKGPWPRLPRRRQTLETATSHPWVAACGRQDPHGRVTHVPHGPVPSRDQSGARYVAPDVGSPPSAVRRSERYEGARVTSHARSQRPDRGEHATGEADPCLGRMGPQTLPQGGQRLR